MSVFLFLFTVFSFAILYALWSKIDYATRALEVVDLAYDIDGRTLDVTVTNTRHKAYNMVSALRLDHSYRPSPMEPASPIRSC